MQQAIILKTEYNPFLWLGDLSGREKLTIGVGEKRSHYTIMRNAHTQTINIHKTFEGSSGKKEYLQICEISCYCFKKLLVEFNTANTELLKKYWIGQRINIGKIKRYNMIVFPFSEDETMMEKLIISRRKKKISLNKDFDFTAFVNLSLYPSELDDTHHSAFLLYSGRRGHLRLQGFIFRMEFDPRMKSFYFITKRSFSKYTKEMTQKLNDVLAKIEFKNEIFN